MGHKFYNLPPLPYPPDFLEPVISKEQLVIHHDKHHATYVEKANEILNMLDDQSNQSALDFGTLYKKLSFNVGGHILHSLFWENMTSASSGNQPSTEIADKINHDFGSFENFKTAVNQTATTIEGSGWVAVFYCLQTERLLVGQIGNHNLNIYPTFKILLVMDMWEHAYYIDYKNDKKSYANNFWDIINWQAVNNRYIEIIK